MRLSNRSSLRVYQVNQENMLRNKRPENIAPQAQFFNDQNPYDLNLLDRKGKNGSLNKKTIIEAILF